MINIKIDGRQMTAAQQLLKDFPAEVNRAAAAAINRALTTVRKATSVTIRKQYVVKAGDIKKSMTMKRTDRNTLSGLIKTVGRPLFLEKFKLSKNANGRVSFDIFIGKAGKRKKRNPIRVQVLAGGGLKALRRGALYRPPVKSRIAGGSGALLRRVGKSRYPVKTPAGPSVPQMMGADRVLDDLTPLAQAVLEERFAHEISLRAKRWGR